MLTDPAFWLASIAWLVVFLFAIGLCVAAARGDRMSDSARRREALKRISGGPGSGWRR